jgi:hypothetical protein
MRFTRSKLAATLGALALIGVCAACSSSQAATTPSASSSTTAPASAPATQTSPLMAATVLQRDDYAGDYQPGGDSQAWVNNTFANAAPYVSSAEGGYYAGQQDGENGEIVAIMSKKGVDVYGESTLQADLGRSYNPTTITLDPSGVYIIRMSTGQ